jgi:hypothetical protein
VTVLIVTKALLDPARPVIELAGMDYSLPEETCINDAICRLWLVNSMTIEELFFLVASLVGHPT